MLYTFKALDKNQTIKALGHFICNGKHALYLKGTNFDKADNSGSMHLLMKHAIEFFADRATFFDFGGGSKQGLANFYMGFGGQASTYSFLQVNRLPRLIKFIKNKK
jgi:lipid II:glycine glycyltransferase (peptidoglycan interpeptide bridge formation enzyme)